MYSRVYVEITNLCNLRCSFCHGHSRPARQLTTGEFSHILRQLEGHTRYLYYHLMGEPLLHPDLPEFLTLAGSRGFFSMLTTNGTLLQKRGDALLSAGLHKVNISLHSLESGDPSQYLQEIAEFTQKAQAAGTIISLRLWNRGCDGGENPRFETLLRQLLPGDWTENTRGYRIRDKVFLEYGDRFGWPDRDNPSQEGQVTCYGMRDHFGILSDGTVVPCCLDSDGVIALGNLFETPLTEILESPRALAIRDSLRNRTAAEALCRRCPYAHK